MAVNPTGGSPSPLAGTGAGRARQIQNRTEDAAGSAAPRAAGRDRAEISATARRLAASPLPPTGQLTAARSREILDRLRDGFYERPAVHREVLTSIARDLGVLAGGGAG